MVFQKNAWSWLVLLCLGLGLAIGLAGCQSGSAPKGQKESKVSLSPQAAEHFRQGHKFLAEKKLNEALKEFQEAAKVEPNSPLVNFWLGKAFLYSRDKDQAEKTFLKVLQLDPQNYHAKAMLGQIYSLDKDKLDQAEQYLNQALEESPDNLEAHFDLGRVSAMKGEREKAAREFGFIFNREADFAAYHFEMGRILEAWGQKDVALSHYKRALVLNSRFELASQALQRLEGEGKPSPTVGASGAAPSKPVTPTKPGAGKP